MVFTALIQTAFVFIAPKLSADPPKAYQLRAAYLYNFTKFIKWPATAFVDDTSPLIIGVLGLNPFQGALGPMASRRVGNRPIKIKYYTSLKEVQTCHLLYISSSKRQHLEYQLDILQKYPILTVGEQDSFVKYGGVIQFVIDQRRLRFMINLGVARKINIKISSQLLALASNVVE